MPAKRVEAVRIATSKGVITIPQEAAQRLRGRLIGARHHSIGREFARKGTSAPIDLDEAEKNNLPGAVPVCMQVGNDEQANELLALRTALIADIEESRSGAQTG